MSILVDLHGLREELYSSPAEDISALLTTLYQDDLSNSSIVSMYIVAFILGASGSDLSSVFYHLDENEDRFSLEAALSFNLKGQTRDFSDTELDVLLDGVAYLNVR